MARVRVALGGEGGQGVQSIAKILVEAAYHEDKNVIYIPNFGIEQRGGVSIAFSQISDSPIGEAKFAKGDIVIMLSDRAIERCAQYVCPDNTVVIYDDSVCETKPTFKAKEIIAVPATQMAIDKFTTRVFNMIVLGVTVKATGIIKPDSCEAAMMHAFGKKFEADPKLKELNFNAFRAGMDMIQSTANV